MDGYSKKNVISANIKLHASRTNFLNIRLLQRLQNVIKLNKNSEYKDTEADRNAVIDVLDEKYKAIESIDDTVYGEKNLLYFSAFLDDNYIDLMDMCLKSIVKHTSSINFDILFITDTKTKEKLSKLDILSHFNINYMVLPSVSDGPEASMKKLNIFDYEHVNQYKKILFLDIDSLCVKNLNELFDRDISSNFLYISYSNATKMQNVVLIPFGLMHLSDRDIDFFYENHSRIMPFNAGQFFMINSKKMRLHFENIRWLANIWPGPYFYEQSFLNYYFVFRDRVKLLADDYGNKLISIAGIHWNGEKRIFNFFDIFAAPPVRANKKLIVTGGSSNIFWNNINVDTESKVHDANTIVIHFAGFGPGPLAKKKYIIEYAGKHNLSI